MSKASCKTPKRLKLSEAAKRLLCCALEFYPSPGEQNKLHVVS